MANEKTRGLLLLSGGIDSPVAGHCAIAAGTEIIAVHFSSEPFTDNSPEKKSLELSKALGIKKLYVVNLGKAFEEIVNKCSHAHYFVLTKRLMFRIAEKIAEKEKCKVLLTGESLGQVSSQTLANLTAIDAAVKIPVIRPLLTINKENIIHIAREINTYEISKGPEMCDVLGPKHPATHASNQRALEEEKKLNYNSLINESLKTKKEIEF